MFPCSGFPNEELYSYFPFGIFSEKNYVSKFALYYVNKWKFIYVQIFSFQIYVLHQSVNFFSLVEYFFAENLQANFYWVKCRASIIKWQYVTFKTNNDALKEYVDILAIKFPKEFPDTHAFIAWLDVFKLLFKYRTEEKPCRSI